MRILTTLFLAGIVACSASHEQVKKTPPKPPLEKVIEQETGEEKTSTTEDNSSVAQDSKSLEVEYTANVEEILNTLELAKKIHFEPGMDRYKWDYPLLLSKVEEPCEKVEDQETRALACHASAEVAYAAGKHYYGEADKLMEPVKYKSPCDAEKAERLGPAMDLLITSKSMFEAANRHGMMAHYLHTVLKTNDSWKERAMEISNASNRLASHIGRSSATSRGSGELKRFSAEYLAHFEECKDNYK